jgi:hypothetical protein
MRAPEDARTPQNAEVSPGRSRPVIVMRRAVASSMAVPACHRSIGAIPRWRPGPRRVACAPMEEIDKPTELLAARDSAAALFASLRAWFAVPADVTLDLRAVDSAVAELGDPQLVMAMAMRKLQALHLLTTPGVRTTTDVVLTVIQDLERALLQAPNLHLKQAAAETDWDAALHALDAVPETAARPAPDPTGVHADEYAAFRAHHARLHEAARAVLHASEGEIRVLR